MSVLTHQSAINPNKNFWATVESGNNFPIINTSTITANTIKVSTITNAFDYLGVSTTTFSPIFFRQDAPVASQMPRLQMKLTQRGLDAGAVNTLELGVDRKNGTAYINSVWDGFILMPMEMNVQSLTIKDEVGTNMIINNLTTQVPQLSTGTLQAGGVTADMTALFSTLSNLYPSNFS